LPGKYLILYVLPIDKSETLWYTIAKMRGRKTSENRKGSKKMYKTVMTVKEMIETLRRFNENDLIALDADYEMPLLMVGNAKREGNWIDFNKKETIMMESYVSKDLEKYLNK
jgi:hypothetical protein